MRSKCHLLFINKSKAGIESMDHFPEYLMKYFDGSRVLKMRNFCGIRLNECSDCLDKVALVEQLIEFGFS